MRSVLVIVLEIRTQKPGQVAFIPDDDMVQAFAAYAAIQSFDTSILPWASIGCHDLFDSHRIDAFSKRLSVRTSSISKKISGGRVPRERFGNLLSGPFSGRVSGDVKVNDLAPSVAYNYKDEQHTKPDCGDDQEVYRHHFGRVIFDKGLPSLGRGLWIMA